MAISITLAECRVKFAMNPSQDRTNSTRHSDGRYTGKRRVFRKPAEQITKGTRFEKRLKKVVVSFRLYARAVLAFTHTHTHCVLMRFRKS